MSELLARLEPSAAPACSGSYLGLPVNATLFLATSRLMGTNASWLFLGFLLKQSYTYYRGPQAKKESLSIRLLVIVTIFNQLFDTAAFTYSAYGFSVQTWGISSLNVDPAYVSSIFGELSILNLCIASATTQFFFTWRILTFAKVARQSRWRNFSRVSSAVILLMNICASACSFFLFVASFIEETYPTWWDPVLLLVNASMAAADILITVCMTGLLLHAQSQAYFGETRDMVTRFIRLTLQTGLLTSFLSICGLVLAASKISYYAIFWEILTKSYAVSLFANLNARSDNRNKHRAPVESAQDEPAGNSMKEDGPNSREQSNAARVSSTSPGAGEALMAN